jgi:hypothetical protein
MTVARVVTLSMSSERIIDTTKLTRREEMPELHGITYVLQNPAYAYSPNAYEPFPCLKPYT